MDSFMKVKKKSIGSRLPQCGCRKNVLKSWHIIKLYTDVFICSWSEKGGGGDILYRKKKIVSVLKSERMRRKSHYEYMDDTPSNDCTISI